MYTVCAGFTTPLISTKQSAQYAQALLRRNHGFVHHLYISALLLSLPVSLSLPVTQWPGQLTRTASLPVSLSLPGASA